MSTKYVINPGQTVTYVTNTIFGQGAPAAVVIPNRSPIVSVAIPDTAVTQGNFLTFAIPNNSFSDPDGDAITYKASLENGNPLPTWLAFDPSTRIFSGTPSDIGDIDVKVTATDPKQAFTTDIFKIKVNQPTVGVIPPGEKDSIYEFLSREVAYNNVWATLTEDKTLKSVYKGEEFNRFTRDYVVDKIFDDPVTGFYALGLTSNTSAPVLVIRGTELKLDDLTDIFSDLNSGGIGFDQYQQNNTAISQWLSATSKRPDITGHSLGGALAQSFAAEATNKGQQLGSIITFNSPGIDETVANKFKADNAKTVKHYIVSGDIVSLGGEEFIQGEYEIFDFVDINLINNHLKPVLINEVNYGDTKKPPSVKASDVVSVSNNSSSNSLSSNFFGYFDPEYLAVLSLLELAAQKTSSPTLKLVPPALLFRGTTEILRDKIGGEIAAIGTLAIGNIPVTGDFSVKDINATPKIWGLKDASLKFNTANKTVSGSANIWIPGGVAVEGSIGFARGQLDSIGLNFNKDVPIPGTGASFKSIGGSVKNLVGPDPTEVSGNIGIADTYSSLNKIIDIQLPYPFKSIIPGHIWSLDLTGKVDQNSLTGVGNLSILGGLAKGTATATLDWNQRLLTAKTDLSILDGFISANTDFKANSNRDIVLSGTGSITSPIGFISGGVSVNGKFLLEYMNDNNSSNDFVAAYNKINFPDTIFGQFPSIERSIKVSFNGQIDWSVGKEIFDYPTQIVGIRAQSLSIAPALSYKAPLSEFLTVDANQSTIQPNTQLLSYKAPLAEFVTIENNQYSVQPNAQWLILNAEWGTASNNPVQVRLKSPDGKIIDESDFAANNIAIVNDLTDNKNRSVIVAQPLAGSWSIEVVNPTGLDSLRYRAFRDSVAPTIELDSLVDNGNQNFTINYKAVDSDSSAKVSLFYAVDNQNFNGVLIKNGLAENDGAGSYSWNAKELAIGDYYVYAMISDGDSAPVFKYAPGKVTVTDSVDISNPPTIVNNAPVASKPLANASATQDQPFTLALPVGAFTDTDADDVLTYSATLVDSSPIPTWLQLDQTTGAFAGTPTNIDLGNLQVRVNASDKANATVSNTFDLNVLAPVANNPTIPDNSGIPGIPAVPVEQFTIQKATNSDIWNINGSGKVKVSLLGKNTSQLNEIGIFKLDANNQINGIAPGTAGFAKAAIESGSVVFDVLPDRTTDGLDLNRSLQVNNGERLGFFLVSNGSVEDDIRNNNFSNVTTSADLVNPYIVAPIQVLESQGAYNLNWKQEQQDLSLQLEVDNTPNTPLSSISSFQGKPEGEILDLRAFAGQDVQATFTMKREAAYNDSVSFYKIDDAAGTVTSFSGETLRPGDPGYAQAALANVVSGLNLSGSNGQTVTAEKTLQGGSLYAPILMTNVTTSRPTGDNLFTAFSLGNADRTDHVRLLGGNTFGFEDLMGGGDKDFNDVIVQASFKIS